MVSIQAESIARSKPEGFWRGFWKQRSIQVFVLIGMLFIVVFNYIPMIGILMAFEKYNIVTGVKGLFTSQWVGLKHFADFYNGYNFWKLIRNTLVMSMLKLLFSFPLPIILALMLNEIKKPWFKKLVQTTSYLPYFISWVIVTGFVQIFMQQNGVVNTLLMSMGQIEKPISFLTETRYFLPVAIVSSCWKDTGWWAILFLASMTGIDPTLYEAAEIDGAGRLQRIRHITLPGIAGTITVVLIMALGNLLGGGLSGSNFEQSYLLGNAGNSDVSDIIQTYVMEVGLSKGRYSYAAAVGLCQSIVSVVLVMVSNFISRKVTGSGLF